MVKYVLTRVPSRPARSRIAELRRIIRDMENASADPSLFGLLNTREWAIGVWLVIGVIFACVVAGKSVLGLVKAALNGHLVGAALVFLTSVASIVFICQRIGLWDWSQSKTTLLWVIFVAPGLVGRMIAKEGHPRLLQAWFKETVGAVVLIELIVNTYTFSIWIELALVPVLVFLGAMLAFAQGKSDYKAVVGFLNGLVALVGLYLLGRGVWMIVANWSSFATLETLREAYTAPLLSLAIIPFLYVFYLYVRYETAFAPLQFSIENARLRDYAKTMAIVMFNIQTPLLRRWQKQLARTRPTTKAEVINTLSAVIRGYKREKNPTPVDPRIGWCPIIAGRYLNQEDVVASDYHASYVGKWYTDAFFKRRDGRYSPHGLVYALEGDEAAVHELRLSLNVNGPDNADEENEMFRRAGALLLAQALSAVDADNAQPLFEAGAPFTMEGATTVALEREDFAVKDYRGHELTLVLRRNASVAQEQVTADAT